MMETYIQTLDLSYAEDVYHLESQSYPEDEAATLAKIQYRLEHASAYFVGLFEKNHELIGFINGTCAAENHLTHESMSKHDPNGSTLCIHSVAIRPELRRKGLASNLLQRYIQYLKEKRPEIRIIALISKQHLIRLYESVGFVLIGPSDVVHGADVWYELRLELNRE